MSRKDLQHIRLKRSDKERPMTESDIQGVAEVVGGLSDDLATASASQEANKTYSTETS